jgi:hypothetical protein
MLTQEQFDDLTTLLERGYELHAWIVPKDAIRKKGEFGVLINDPLYLDFGQADMADSEYGKTLELALVEAIRRWR